MRNQMAQTQSESMNVDDAAKWNGSKLIARTFVHVVSPLDWYVQCVCQVFGKNMPVKMAAKIQPIQTLDGSVECRLDAAVSLLRTEGANFTWNGFSIV